MANPIPLRVAARHLQRKIADADLPRLLKTFESIIANMAKGESKILQDTEDFGNIVNAGADAKSAFWFVKKAGIELLFLGILQTYVMAPKERRVIERASKTFAKRQIRVNTKNAVAVYSKSLKEYRLFFDTARRVIASGKLHTEEGSTTTLKAGPFTLINTGGFSNEIMETVAKVVAKAASTLASKGLGRLCYGNVQVTNTVGRSARILAFGLNSTHFISDSL